MSDNDTAESSMGPYVPVSMNFSNVKAGTQVIVQINTSSGVTWSFGPIDSGGMSVGEDMGSIPLTNLNVTPQIVTLNTSSDGQEETVQVLLQLWFAAPQMQKHAEIEFVANSGAQVEISVNNGVPTTNGPSNGISLDW